jgi:hypothetical protein
MAVNRFVNINWDKPISSFVPLPFEAAYAAGERIQKDHDAGKAISGEIDKLSDAIKVIPNDEPAKQYMLNQYRSAIKQTVDKYQGNYGNADYQREAANIVNQFKNDTRLSIFNNNIDRYKELNENLKNPEKARDIHHSLQQFQNPDASIRYNDPVNPIAFSPTYSTKAGDIPKTLNEIYQGITKDGTPTSQLAKSANIVGDKMFYTDWKGEIQEIKADKVLGIAYANLHNYLSTEAGTHQLRSKLETLKAQGLIPENFNTYKINAENYQSLFGDIKTGRKLKQTVGQGKDQKTVENDETLYDYINNDIVDDIFAGGKKYIHKMATGSWDRSGVFDPISDYTRKKMDEESTLTPVYETGEVSVEGNKSKYDFSTTFGDVKTSSRMRDPMTFGVGDLFNIQSKYISDGKNKAIAYKELNDNEKRLIDGMMSTLSNNDPLKAKFLKYKNIDAQKENSGSSKAVANRTDYINTMTEIYKRANNLASKAIDDLRSNMSVSGLTGKDKEELNTIFGGKLSGEMTVNDLTTGIGTNAYIYDPSTGDYKSMKDFTSENNGMFGVGKNKTGNMPVRLSGKLDPKNHLTSLTNNMGFADGLQVVINGKPYYITGPDRYKDSKGNISLEKQEEKAVNQTINRMYQLQKNQELIGSDNILGTNVKTAFINNQFVIRPEENISFKQGNTSYSIDVKDREFSGITPEESMAQYNAFVKQQIQSLQSKKKK